MRQPGQRRDGTGVNHQIIGASCVEAKQDVAGGVVGEVGRQGIAGQASGQCGEQRYFIFVIHIFLECLNCSVR